MRSKRHYYDVRQYAVLQRANGDILTLQLPAHYKPYGSMWTLPGGKLEPKDTLEDGILREIEEETCLNAEVVDLLHVARWDTKGSRKLTIFYHCKLVDDNSTPILSEEHRSAEWVAPEDIEKVEFYSPYFIDAISKLTHAK